MLASQSWPRKSQRNEAYPERAPAHPRRAGASPIRDGQLLSFDRRGGIAFSVATPSGQIAQLPLYSQTDLAEVLELRDPGAGDKIEGGDSLIIVDHHFSTRRPRRS